MSSSTDCVSSDNARAGSSQSCSSWSVVPLPKRPRVIATALQRVALNTLYECRGDNATKDDIERVSRETGLENRWIKKWIGRQSASRRRKLTASTRTSCTGSPNSTPRTSSSNAVGSSRFIHDGASQYAPAYNQVHTLGGYVMVQTGPSSSHLEQPTSVPGESLIQIAKPGTSFTVPLHSAGYSAMPSSQTQNSFGLRSLPEPPLGYMPLAFPVAGLHENMHPPSGHAQESPNKNSATLLPDASGARHVLHDVLPTQAGLAEGHNPNARYLSQLLHGTTHAIPLERFTTETSSYLSVLSRPAAGLSSSPSLQLQPTSVLRTASGSEQFLPPPIAYKARYSDITTLTRRIRATFFERAVPVEYDDANCDDADGSAQWETDMQVEKRVSRGDDFAEATALGVRPDPVPMLSRSGEVTEDEEEVVTPSGEIQAFTGSNDCLGYSITPEDGKADALVREMGIPQRCTN
ncbi:hypothetical protein A0H81_11195 [Grifola frondosa]|uniref:Homeobox domain-containing protein n=1 Tax=Grifola frondosa TaxID=5627 RepID=A0A1C7LX14_GRIFR|nr:hypothetical protein A0H81_11195 [Grifola frondosa]